MQTPRGLVRLNGSGRYGIVVGTTDDPTLVTVLEGSASVESTNLTLTVEPNQAASLTGTDTFQGVIVPAQRDAFLTEMLGSDRPPPARLPPQVAETITAMPGGDDLASVGSWSDAPEYGQVWYPPVDPGLGAVPARSLGLCRALGMDLDRRCLVGLRAVPLWPLGGTRRPLGLDARVPSSCMSARSMRRRWWRSSGWAPAWRSARRWPPVRSAGCRWGRGSRIIPWYRASPAYVRQVNVSHVTNITNINNVTVNNFVNRGAATSVPAAAMAGSRPIASVARPISAQQFATARPVFGQQPLRPTATTMGVTPAVAQRLNIAPPVGGASGARPAPVPSVPSPPARKASERRADRCPDSLARRAGQEPAQEGPCRPSRQRGRVSAFQHASAAGRRRSNTSMHRRSKTSSSRISTCLSSRASRSNTSMHRRNKTSSSRISTCLSSRASRSNTSMHRRSKTCQQPHFNVPQQPGVPQQHVNAPPQQDVQQPHFNAASQPVAPQQHFNAPPQAMPQVHAPSAVQAAPQPHFNPPPEAQPHFQPPPQHAAAQPGPVPQPHFNPPPQQHAGPPPAHPNPPPAQEHQKRPGER